MRDWTRRYFSDVFLTAPADLPVAWPTPRDSDPNDPTHARHGCTQSSALARIITTYDACVHNPTYS